MARLLLLPLLLAASSAELAASAGEGVGEAVRTFLTTNPATAKVNHLWHDDPDHDLLDAFALGER